MCFDQVWKYLLMEILDWTNLLIKLLLLSEMSEQFSCDRTIFLTKNISCMNIIWKVWEGGKQSKPQFSAIHFYDSLLICSLLAKSLFFLTVSCTKQTVHQNHTLYMIQKLERSRDIIAIYFNNIKSAGCLPFILARQ